MSEAEAATAAPVRRHFAFITIIVLLAICTLSYVAWSQGMFKSREKIALVTSTNSEFWNPVEAGAQEAAKEFGVDLQFIRCAPDDAAQTKTIQDLLSQGIEGLAISPINPANQAAAIDDATSKATVITFDSDAPNTKRKAFVGTNNYAAGMMSGDLVRDAIPDGGQVIISVGSVDKINGRERRQGLIDNLLDRSFKSIRDPDELDAKLVGDKYSIVATVIDGGDQAKATQMVADALKAHPDTKCVVGLFSYSGAAIAKAVEQAGKTGKVQIIAFDEAAEVQTLMAAGAIKASILQDQHRLGYDTVRMLADLMRGRNTDIPTRNVIEMRVLVMKADDIDEYRKTGIIRQVK
jgi:ribose transport system substrate-binding protein